MFLQTYLPSLFVKERNSPLYNCKQDSLKIFTSSKHPYLKFSVPSFPSFHLPYQCTAVLSYQTHIFVPIIVKYSLPPLTNPEYFQWGLIYAVRSSVLLCVRTIGLIRYYNIKTFLCNLRDKGYHLFK